MRGLFSETLIEFLDRKQHWVFLAITAIAGAVLYFAVSEKLELVQTEVFSYSSLLLSVSNSFSQFVNVLVLVSLISTMFLLPRLLRKGRIEFYLSKPITRPALFYSKIISHWAIYSFMTLFCSSIIGVELYVLDALPLGSAVYIMACGLAVFLIWYSVILFAGFLTKSVSINFGCLTVLWVAQLLLKHRLEWGIEQRLVQYGLDFFYYILPKTSEMSSMSVELATVGSNVNYWPIVTSMVLAGMLIYTTNSLFSRQDF